MQVLPTEVESASVAGGRAGGGVNLGTEARLLKSEPVVTRVKALLGVPDEPRDLAANVTVAVPLNTSVLNISYSAATPQDAQRGARAFAQAYPDNRAAVAEAKRKTKVEAMRAQLAAALQGLRAVTAKKARLPKNSPERTYMDFREKMLINQITWLSAHLHPLETTRIMPGRIIRNPTVPAGD